ncbi:MAG: hypothetical protein ACPG8O_06820, partial [Alcanivorax nanhaiticus]
MTRSWHPSIPPALALLLTALMLVTGTAVAMESSAMAASTKSHTAAVTTREASRDRHAAALVRLGCALTRNQAHAAA